MKRMSFKRCQKLRKEEGCYKSVNLSVAPSYFVIVIAIGERLAEFLRRWGSSCISNLQLQLEFHESYHLFSYH
jgi:hypothetical protein